jgi:hypothetical protein
MIVTVIIHLLFVISKDNLSMKQTFDENCQPLKCQIHLLTKALSTSKINKLTL